MKRLIMRPLPSIVAAIAFLSGLASIAAFEGVKLEVALIIFAAVVSACIAYSCGRGIRDKR